MLDKNKQSLSPTKCLYISTPSNFQNSVPLKKKSAHIKTSPHQRVMSKESQNCQEEPDKSRTRCKEIGVEVAKFLQQINNSENNFNSLYSSFTFPDLKTQDESLVEQNKKLQYQLAKQTKQLYKQTLELEKRKEQFEFQVKQCNDMKEKFDENIKSLHQEIQTVNERITSCEMQRDNSYTEQRDWTENNTNLSLQTFQRSFNENDQTNEINKLLDQILEKNKMLHHLNIMIEKFKLEAAQDSIRNLDEIERLKSRISSLQVDHQTQIFVEKNKMKIQMDTAISNMACAQQNQTEILMKEVSQLKCLIEVKNQESEKIRNQNEKLKYQLERENTALRQKIEEYQQLQIQSEKQYQNDIEQLKRNIELMNQNEINSLKQNFQSQISAQEIEIRNLKDFLSTNNLEQQHLKLQKLQQKEYYEIKFQRLNNDLEEQKQLLLNNKLNFDASTDNKQIKAAENSFKQVVDDQIEQIKQLSFENGNLKYLISQKDQELKNIESIGFEYQENIRKLEEMHKSILDQNISLERTQNDKIKFLLGEQEEHYENEINDIEYQMQRLVNDNQKYFNLTSQQNALIDELGITISNLQFQVQTIQNESNQYSSTQTNVLIKGMSEQISELQAELMKKNQELTKMIEQHQQLESMLFQSSIRNTEMNLNDMMKKQIRRSSQAFL